MSIRSATLLLLATACSAQRGVISPLAQRCAGAANLTNVACVNKYAAVMPVPFSRPNSLGDAYNNADRFSNTSVNDPSFQLVRDATFVVFDEKRGFEALGSSPSIESVFITAPITQEAPVYVPGLNAIIASTLSQGVIAQVFINLNESMPTLEEFHPDPPVYGVNGGRYFNGTVYWAVAGGNVTVNGTSIVQAPGIYALDPLTRKVTVLLNNYFGQFFNSPDDLVVASNGDIFFTDPAYGFALNLTVPRVLAQNTYRFRPCTGAVHIVESTVNIPNGITLSPDEKTLYITDTGVTKLNDGNVIPRYTWDATGGKVVYAFDLVDSPAGAYPINKRAIWYPEEFADDGFHAARNGLLVGASGFGVDVFSTFGELILRIQTDFFVVNAQFAGPDLDQLWMFGVGEIGRVKWNLRGLPDARS